MCPHVRANIAVLTVWLKRSLKMQSWGLWKTELPSLTPTPCFILASHRQASKDWGYHHITHVGVGRCPVLSPSWSSCMHLNYLNQFFFSLIEAHSIIFWTYWSSVMHRLIIVFLVFLPAGLSVSLFLYWSPCPHSWYQSHFYKSISKAFSLEWMFHSQENSTNFFCTWNIGLLSWYNLIQVNIWKVLLVCEVSTLSIFPFSFICKSGVVFHGKSVLCTCSAQGRKGLQGIGTCRQTSFGCNQLRGHGRSSGSWSFKEGPRGKATRGPGPFLVVLSVTL